MLQYVYKCCKNLTFQLRIFSSEWDQIHSFREFGTFTKEICKWKLKSLCSVFSSFEKFTVTYLMPTAKNLLEVCFSVQEFEI